MKKIALLFVFILTLTNCSSDDEKTSVSNNTIIGLWMPNMEVYKLNNGEELIVTNENCEINYYYEFEEDNSGRYFESIEKDLNGNGYCDDGKITSDNFKWHNENGEYISIRINDEEIERLYLEFTSDNSCVRHINSSGSYEGYNYDKIEVYFDKY